MAETLLRFRVREPGRAAGRSEIQKKRPANGGSVFVGAHDGEHARRPFGVGGIFRGAFHVGGVVIHLEEVANARDLEAAEIVLPVWIVFWRELVEMTNTL